MAGDDASDNCRAARREPAREASARAEPTSSELRPRAARSELRRSSALLVGPGFDGGDTADEAGLAPGRLVGVDDTLGGRLVDPLHGLAQALGRVLGAGLGREEGVLRARLQLRAHGLVGEAATLVLAVPLDLTLDVGHWSLDAYGLRRTEPPGAPRVPAGRDRPAHRGRDGTMDAVVAPEVIRNFSIISHVDHGKSTLSDRILELTYAVDPRDMRAQYLDSMDLERERGITIKAQNVRVHWRDHVLQLIDTPGHVDFGYEVSRSLAACEGVVLLVDASQGIEAQTLANCYLALEHDLEIVAALNKIDLPAADPDRYAEEIERVLGLPGDQILRISAKTGAGVAELLDEVVRRIPAPKGDPDDRLRALLFDSYYDQYRGVVSAVRVVDGTMRSGPGCVSCRRGPPTRSKRSGIRTPAPVPVDELGPGEVGYLIAGIKDVGEARVGETVTEAARPATEPLEGYQNPKPMVFCGIYPIDGDEFPDLRDALEKLKLNDASVTYEPETSAALGFGFRCGFLGLLHMEIVRERLEREFGLSLIATAPSVEYIAHLTNGDDPAGRQPLGDARAAVHRPHRRAAAEAHDHQPGRVHRDDHGPVPDTAGPAWRRWSTSRPTGSSSSTSCRSPRSCSTSSTC